MFFIYRHFFYIVKISKHQILAEKNKYGQNFLSDLGAMKIWHERSKHVIVYKNTILL
jgi:hypothetical protein